MSEVPIDAIVTDKERAMVAAVELVSPGIPNHYCQQSTFA